LSAGAQGPPNPFARPPPPVAATRNDSYGSNSGKLEGDGRSASDTKRLGRADMGVSMLFELFPLFGFFGRSGPDSNMLPSPLTFPTPAVQSGPSFSREDELQFGDNSPRGKHYQVFGFLCAPSPADPLSGLFLPEWGFGRSGPDSNMLPSPLTFPTPAVQSGPSFSLHRIQSDSAGQIWAFRCYSSYSHCSDFRYCCRKSVENGPPGVVLPPPSPSAGAILSAGAQGPPNPFARMLFELFPLFGFPLLLP
jgi:hypothetical protein